MASFRFFPDLPYELREHIWQQAIRPSAKNRSGIQHFSILHSNMKFESTASKPKFIPSCRGVPTCTNNGPTFAAEIPGTEAAQTNRSAYMWDAGLWTACYESRQIILRHWEMKKWREKRRNFLSKPTWLFHGEDEEKWREIRDYCTTINAPSLTANDGGEEWKLMVRPYEDAFYFDMKSLGNALEQLYPYKVTDDECHLSVILRDLPFSGLNWGSLPVRYLILDFDPNWLNNLPRSPYDICRESQRVDVGSPQALIIELLWLVARGDTKFHILLIDRSLRQSSIKNRDEMFPARAADEDARIFYNCDEEFINLGIGYKRSDKPNFDRPWKYEYNEDGSLKYPNVLKCDEKKLSAALTGEENGFASWYIWWLALHLNETLSEPDEWEHPQQLEPFWVEEHISILGYKS